MKWFGVPASASLAAIFASVALAGSWSTSWTVGSTTATVDGRWKDKPANLYTHNGKPAIKYKLALGGNVKEGYIRVQDKAFSTTFDSLHPASLYKVKFSDKKFSAFDRFTTTP